MSLCARERAKKNENDVSKGSVKIRHRWYGSAELFGFGHCRFGSAESWFGLKYGNKIRPNRIVQPNLYIRFGQIRRFGAPLLHIKIREVLSFLAIPGKVCLVKKTSRAFKMKRNDRDLERKDRFIYLSIYKGIKV